MDGLFAKNFLQTLKKNHKPLFYLRVYAVFIQYTMHSENASRRLISILISLLVTFIFFFKCCGASREDCRELTEVAAWYVLRHYSTRWCTMVNELVRILR